MHVNQCMSSSRLINVTIDFQLKAINIQTIINNEIPDCYTFAITVRFFLQCRNRSISPLAALRLWPPSWEGLQWNVLSSSFVFFLQTARLSWITKRTVEKWRSVSRTTPPLKSVKTPTCSGTVSEQPSHKAFTIFAVNVAKILLWPSEVWPRARAPSGESYAREFFDVLVALVCLLSLLLCGRSILRGVILQHVGLQHYYCTLSWLIVSYLSFHYPENCEKNLNMHFGNFLEGCYAPMRWFFRLVEFWCPILVGGLVGQVEKESEVWSGFFHTDTQITCENVEIFPWSTFLELEGRLTWSIITTMSSWYSFFWHFCLFFCTAVKYSSEFNVFLEVLKCNVSSLRQEYVQYFKHVLGRRVSWGDRLEFINGWYILLIISDAFTIVGSFIKIGIESKVKKKK